MSSPTNMNNALPDASDHALAGKNLVNHEQEQPRQQPATRSQLDDVLPESYERTYFPDSELQLPVRVAVQPRNQQRPFPMATGVPPNGYQHPSLPIGTSTANGGKKQGVRRRTVSAPARGAAKAANTGRGTTSWKVSLVVLPPKITKKEKTTDGEHPPLSGGATHNTPSKSSPRKDVEETASISSGTRLTIKVPALKAAETKGDASGEDAKENPSVVETLSAKKIEKKATRTSTHNAEKLEAPKTKEVEAKPAGVRPKRKELHEDDRRADKDTTKRAKKNDAKPVEDKPKVILRIPRKPTPITNVKAVTESDEAGESKAEREEIGVPVDEPKLRRGSRQKVPTWKKRQQ